MGKEEKQKFPAISSCDPSGRENHGVAADLDGTLLVGRNAFPYFVLLAIEAGGILRGILLLLSSPIILFLYRLVSESAGIRLLIFISLAGLGIDRIKAVSATVLPRFYAADVRSDAWKAFSACKRRRVVVTANPTVIVEPFVKRWLGGDKVLGTELEVDECTGKATGFVTRPGILVAEKKRDAILREFGDGNLPELGLGDRESDHDFMALCKEAYMVPPDKKATKVPPEQLSSALFSVNSALRRPPRHTHKTPRLTLRLSRPPPLSPPPYPPRRTPFQVLKQNKKPNQLRPTRTPAGLAKINSSGLETLTRLIY